MREFRLGVVCSWILVIACSSTSEDDTLNGVDGSASSSSSDSAIPSGDADGSIVVLEDGSTSNADAAIGDAGKDVAPPPKSTAKGLNTTLTCSGIPLSPPVTERWTEKGKDVSVRFGVNHTIGGVGVEFALINNAVPTGIVNVLEPRSAGGAGWQTAYWFIDPGTKRIIVTNQAAGNSTGQWGYNTTFSGMAATSWNPLWSDHYHDGPTFADTSIPTSPCNKDGYMFDEGALTLTSDLLPTAHGDAVSVTNRYWLKSTVSQFWSSWALEQAFYLNRTIANQGNLRVYLRGKKNAWKEGPIKPQADYTVKNGSGSCSGTGCDYGISRELAYGVLVWNIFGLDIGVAINVEQNNGPVHLSVDKLPYCGNANDLDCGNIAWHSYINFVNNYTFPKGEERSYPITYTVGTIDQLEDLGFSIK